MKTNKCKRCGSKYEVHEYRAEESVYCSNTCQNREKSLYRDKKWLEEQYCEKKKGCVKIAEEADCSKTTILNWLKEHEIPVRENGEKGENKTCIECGEVFYVPECLNHQTYCSVECRGKDFRGVRLSPETEYNQGEDHRFWRGGGNQYYGSNWNRKRNERLSFDSYKCQSCGGEDNLNVHHHQPIRTFEKPEDGNFLFNLITLCRNCHQKLESKRR